MDDSSADDNSSNSSINATYNEEVELSDVIDDDEVENFIVTSASSSCEESSLCNTDFEESRSTEEGAPPEILEENNNDPNNNMDIEAPQDIINNHNNEPIIELPVSPKAGCSRDFDIENSRESEVHKQILEIQDYLRNLSYVKLGDLIRRKENFKRQLFELFEEASLKRDGEEDICDVESKKVTIQITSLETPQMEIDKVKEDIPIPEELLDDFTGLRESGHHLTPPHVKNQKKRGFLMNSILLDSSDDEAIVVDNRPGKKQGHSMNQNNPGKVAMPKESRIPQRGHMQRTTLTNGHSGKANPRLTSAPTKKVAGSNISNLPKYGASNSTKYAASSTVTTAAVGNPENFPKNSADGEPVPKIKIISHGKHSRVVPAKNLQQPPRIHRPAPDDPRKIPTRPPNDRWNPVFHNYNQSSNGGNYGDMLRTLNEPRYAQDDLTITLRAEADREIAESLNLLKQKKEPTGHKYDHQIIQKPKFKYPQNYGQIDVPRPERTFAALNLLEMPVIDVDGAQALPVPPKAKEGYCQEIYTKLRAMFPNIKKDYIKNITPAEWVPNIGHDVQFGHIVDKLLASEATWELEIPDDDPGDLIGAVGGAADANPRTIDETYEHLLEIFPKADPTYLRTHAEQVFNNDQALEDFIEQTFKKHDYPTREQYLSQMRQTEERLRYTQNFTVEGFLEKFPDPFKHFLDKKRKCVYEITVFEFLKGHFNKIRVNTISKHYTESGYNMSIAASKLSKIGSDMCSTRKVADMPPKDINLLQEMAFVRHQRAIKEHIAKMEQAEKLEFEALKKANGLLECQCCYDNECMPSKCSTCDNGHIFCNSCIVNGTDSRLGEGETHVPCFQACGSEFSLATLQKILKPTKFSILVKKRQAAEVAAAGLEGLVACPFCHFASIPPEGDKVFKCLNLECMKESCIQCKEPNHVPLRCDEVGKADKARKYIEEKMTQALARSCYKCNKAYFKEEGCNKITCPCGAIMCYLCNKKIKDYTHFRGQGSDDMAKCPLYSDNARLNAENVRRVADEAKKELLKQDPALNIDTERLLPNIPPPSAGPHQQILQAPLRLPAANLNHALYMQRLAAIEAHYLQRRPH